jgi:hypothetical protein
MDTILQFIQTQPWYGIVAAVIALASAIAAITPTPAEGSTLAKIYKVLDLLALNIGKAKDKGTVVAQPVDVVLPIEAVTTSAPIPRTSTTPSPVVPVTTSPPIRRTSTIPPTTPAPF